MTRVILADDHEIVRAGLRRLLEAHEDMTVAGEANDGLSAVSLAERLRPDLVILDLMLPGLNGLEVTRRITQVSPETRIVVLSVHADETYVLEALNSGALGYVLKGSPASDVMEAIRLALAGRRFLSLPLADRAIRAYMKNEQPAGLDPYQSLTPREREVLHLTAEGRTNAEIAEILFVSPRTVEVHRSNLMRKLGMRNRAEIVSYAIGRGLVPPRSAPPKT